MKNLQSRKSYIFKIVLCFLFVIFEGCKGISPDTSRSMIFFDTVCSVNLFEDGNKALYDEIFSRLSYFENVFDKFNPSSEVSRINENAGIKPVKVCDEVFFVIEKAVFYAELTDGLFDPTIGVLTDLWNVTGENPVVPGDDEIKNVLPLVNYKNVEFLKNEKSVFLKEKGMKLDLGGIVKGFATDETVNILRKHNVKKAVINLGGNIFVYGDNSKKEKNWNVGIADPFDSSSPLLSIGIKNASIVTSGSYERFFMKDGKICHHIINPKTGYPAGFFTDRENDGLDIRGVTIISSSSLEADALSTSVFLMGKDGLQFLENKTEAFGLCISSNKIYVTENLKDKLSVLKEKFSIQ